MPKAPKVRKYPTLFLNPSFPNRVLSMSSEKADFPLRFTL